jgi:hypothetical protein
MTSNSQEKLSSWFWRFAGIFFFLYVFTLTFEYYLIEWWFDIIAVPFRWLAEQTGMLFFGVNLLGAEEFYSDSLLVFVHVFNLALIAFLGATAWTIVSKTVFTQTKLYPLPFTFLRYFLALNLFVYGFSKLYKWQFMLPEPNILYTRVGEMHRDILYWTSMGSSRSYTMFMGVVEIIPAILLLFRRTTLIGAFASVLVMTNVLAVNFGFDITVKLHSVMLLIMSLVILIPGRKRIVALFTGKAAEEWNYPAFILSENKKWVNTVVKVAAVVFVLAESHYPYTKTGTYNDDVSERPPMCGAYEILATYTINHDSTGNTLQLIGEDHRRFFIHRRGYMIFEKQDGGMVDYTVTVDTTRHLITALRYVDGQADQIHFHYEQVNDSIYTFTEPLINTRSYSVKKIDVSKLPLMQKEFTLIDED